MSEELKIDVAILGERVQQLEKEVKAFRMAAWIVGLGAVGLLAQRISVLMFQQ